MSADFSKKKLKAQSRKLEHLPTSNFRLPTSARQAGFGSPLKVVLLTIAIFIFSQLFSVLIVQFVLYVIYGPGTNLLNDSASAQFLYVFVAAASTVSLIFLTVRRAGMDLSAIGLGRKPTFSDFWRALAGVASFYGILIVLGIVITVFFPEIDLDQQQDVGFKKLVSGADYSLAFISLVLIPPIGEEILIRGYLYSGLRAAMRFTPALLVTSILFGLAHLNGGVNSSVIWLAALNTFVLSVVLVFLREKTGALYAGIAVHMLNNLIAFFVYIN